MMTKENPWEEIAYGTQRRALMEHNIFWIKESKGDYGICIEIQNEKGVRVGELDLKDIEVFEKISKDVFKWYLVLRNKEEWQIFKVLCNDLMEAATSAKTEKAMLSIMEVRLKRWQNLLKKSRNLNLSTEVQMGLYSELECLKSIVALQIGIKAAIQNWVGPDSGRQDFLLDNSALEVKSYRTSKGEKITISSKDQLTSEKENLYLVTYALTKSDNGKSIEDEAKEIKQLLNETGEQQLIDLLDMKLLDYGYSPLIHKPNMLDSFIVDKIKHYIIDEQFPRLTSHQIPAEIITVRYQIDMSLCSEWEIKLENMLI